jgi:hypothetical protein
MFEAFSMTDFCKDRSEITQLLHRVFPLVPIPEEVRSGGQKDDLEVEIAFKGVPWDRITWERIRSRYTSGMAEEAFYLLADTAQRYYLPALINLYLTDEKRFLWEGPLTFILTRPTSPDGRQDSFDSVFEPCTPEQKAAVARCLLFFAEVYKDTTVKGINDFLVAYHSYWVRFDPNPGPPVPAAE